MVHSLRERLVLPLPWAATIVAVLAVGVFAATWFAGNPFWVVALATLLAAALAGVGVAAADAVLATRTVSVVAHLLLGLLVLAAAAVGSLFAVAEGALTQSTPALVALGSVWLLGVTLLAAGVCVLREAHRPLRTVATGGLLVTAVWSVVVAVAVGGVLVDLLMGVDVGLLQDLRDDLLPSLTLFVAFVVFPALVFGADLRSATSATAGGRTPA